MNGLQSVPDCRASIHMNGYGYEAKRYGSSIKNDDHLEWTKSINGIEPREHYFSSEHVTFLYSSICQITIMTDIQRAKFTNNDNLKKYLLSTGDLEIIEARKH